VRRARELRSWLRDRQDQTELLTGIPDDTHKAFLDAGLYRTLQPRRFGGYEFSLRTFSQMITEVARGCPSSGWNLCLAASHSLVIAGRFPEQTQREVFGPDGDFRARCRSPRPALRSGHPTVTWSTADGTIPPESTSPRISWALRSSTTGKALRRSPGMVLVPSGWQVLDNWGEILGFRGSGSNSVVVENVLVPHRYVSKTHIEALDVASGPDADPMSTHSTKCGRRSTDAPYSAWRPPHEPLDVGPRHPSLEPPEVVTTLGHPDPGSYGPVRAVAEGSTPNFSR
jgi:3-hydroxy-9,10-secoandrosta-1,3,5(10)-triene-9,17-dione monooxygenase